MDKEKVIQRLISLAKGDRDSSEISDALVAIAWIVETYAAANQRLTRICELVEELWKNYELELDPDGQMARGSVVDTFGGYGVWGELIREARRGAEKVKQAAPLPVDVEQDIVELWGELNAALNERNNAVSEITRLRLQLNKQRGLAENAKERNRLAAHALIQTIGAPGPEGVHETATRAVQVICDLRGRVEGRDNVVRSLRDKVESLEMKLAQSTVCTSEDPDVEADLAKANAEVERLVEELKTSRVRHNVYCQSLRDQIADTQDVSKKLVEQKAIINGLRMDLAEAEHLQAEESMRCEKVAADVWRSAFMTVARGVE
jgi:chromosome segregation ATPase